MKHVPATVAVALLLATGGTVYRSEPAVRPDPEWTRHAATAFAVVEATILDQAVELERPERRERREWRTADGRWWVHLRSPSAAAVGYFVRARVDRVLKGPVNRGADLNLVFDLGWPPSFGRGQRWLLFVTRRPWLDHVPEKARLQELEGTVYRRPGDGRDQPFDAHAARGLQPRGSMFDPQPSRIRLDRDTPEATLLPVVEASISAARDMSPPALTLHVASGAVLRGSVTISADASDDEGAPRVSLRLGHNSSETRAKPPYSVTIDTRLFPDGPHDVVAVAEDASGLRTYRAVAVTVANGPSPPPPKLAIAPKLGITPQRTPGLRDLPRRVQSVPPGR